MRVTVNGVPREIPSATTVAALVADLGHGSKGMAVALNREVIARSDWSVTELRPGDRVEVLIASQGG